MALNRLVLGYKLAITLFVINVLLGLLFAQIEVRYQLEMKDGEPGISFTDFRLFFQGDPTQNRLQAMIEGPMRNKFANSAEVQTIHDWIADGTLQADYESDVAPILAARCVACHGPGGEQAQAPLTTYDQVTRYTMVYDTGISYDSLAKNSYLHLVAMTCFTGLLSALFYLTHYRGAWKQVVMALAFFMIFINVLSWWSAKQSLFFIHIVMASGLIFAAMIVVMAVMTLLDVWLLAEEHE